MTTVDYSKYTLDELLDVQNNINPNSPNYSDLLKELDNRKEEISRYHETKKQESFNFADKRIIIIGYFQIATAITFFILLLISDYFSFVSVVVTLFIVALNGFAGYTAFKKQKKFYWASLVNQYLQVISLGLGSTLVNYSGFGGIFINITIAETTSFGISMNFNPGFIFQQLPSQIAEPFISVNILAIIFISAITTVSYTTKK